MLDKRAADTAAKASRRPAARFPGASARGSKPQVCSCASIAPINKDTELHPLVRWQFQGGLAEDERRAFLFTNVVDGRRPPLRHSGRGRRAGGLGARSTPSAWGGRSRRSATPGCTPSPIRSRRSSVRSAACQEVVITGDDAAQAGRRPDSSAGADLDAGLRRGALSHRDVVHHARSRNRRPQHGHLSRRAESAPTGSACAWRRAPAAPAAICIGRNTASCKEPMPFAIVIGCAPVVMFTGPQKLADRSATRWRSPAGSPARRSASSRRVTVDLDVPADAEIVIEGLIDPELLEPEGPFGESHGHVALEDFNMSMQVTAITHKRKPVFVSILSQVTPSESSVMKRVAYEPRFLAHLRDHARDQGRAPRRHARAADQSAQGHLPAIRARRAAHRSLARAAWRRDAARRLAANTSSR